MTPTSAEPSIIYHYTTIDGLIGIIQQSKLFATDLFYMNDPQEVQYPFLLINEIVEGIPTVYTESRHAPMLEEFVKSMDASRVLYDRFPRCAACFCVDGDLLSQWRAYARNLGFAIGFDRGQLSDGLDQNSRLRAVVYDRLTQASAISSRIKTCMESEEAADPAMAPKEMMECSGDLWWTASWFKSEAFKEEREWRYVTALNAIEGMSRFRFRPSPIGVTPYIELELETGASSPIVEVVIGPTGHSSEAERAVDLLLRSMGLEHVTIRQSGISLR